MITKQKSLPTELEKIFANDMCDNRSVSKINKKLKQFNIKKIQLKIGRVSEQTFFQGGHADGQQAYEKMFSITNYQANVNQNHSEISPYTFRMAVIKKTTNIKSR